MHKKFAIPFEGQNIKKFEWDFGDGTIINKKPAIHVYKSAGDYSVTLKSWNEYGCYDSIRVADVSVIKKDRRILFPSAFCPNPGGPSQGKYYERETYVDIFHPVTKAEIAEYKLIIYSKAGAIVFETDNIKIGWDGYYLNRLMPEGVYPYIAKGKYEGGEPFLIKGDFTIIYRK